MTERDTPEPTGRSPTGVDDFFVVVKAYGKLIAWSLGAAVAPIAAGLAQLAPPWPPAIIQVTALFEMIALVLTFQFLSHVNVARINRIMITAVITFTLAVIVYLFALSQFVYEEPLSGLKFVKGFACTPEAVAVFPGHCPFYTDDDLRSAEWEASRLWTPWSITGMRLGLVILWTSVFASLAMLLGAFLVYQSGVRARTPGA